MGELTDMATQAEKNAALRARSAGEITDAQLAEVMENDEEEQGLLSRAYDWMFGDDDDRSAREREMVMSPPPTKPNIRREDYDSNLDYTLARDRANNEYRRLMEDRQLNPQNYMVPAAAAAADPNQEIGAFERGRALEQAEKEAGSR